MVVVERYTTWQHFQARFAEWFNASVLFIWGINVVLHPSMFEDTEALYAGMLRIMSQTSWGLIAVIVGLVRLAALYVNGHHARTPTVRLIASFFSAFVFTQVFIGLWNSGVANTGFPVYAGLICADIYSAFRASQDVTFVSHRARVALAESGREQSRK